MPDWIRGVADANPVALGIEGIRSALLGGAGWEELLPTVGLLAAMAVGTLAIGTVAFRLALRRERRLGTLGLY
jgi:hypothetical protein